MKAFVIRPLRWKSYSLINSIHYRKAWGSETIVGTYRIFLDPIDYYRCTFASAAQPAAMFIEIAYLEKDFEKIKLKANKHFQRLLKTTCLRQIEVNQISTTR